MFGHTERVKRRFEQLESLDELIKERTLVAEELQKRIDELAGTVVFLKNKYKDLLEYEDLNAQISKINQEIEEKERELKSLLTKIETYNTLIELEKVKQELEEEKQKLRNLKETYFNPKDLIVVAYKALHQNDLEINIFNFKKYEEYTENLKNKKAIGTIYESIDGDRTIGFTYNYANYIVSDGSPNETLLNAQGLAFITFNEACRKMNNNLPLKERVSISELRKFLNEFLEMYTFYYDHAKTEYLVYKLTK